MEKVNIFDFTGNAKKEQRRNIQDIQGFLKNKFENKFAFGTQNLSSGGVYKEMGWAYDFRGTLKKFLVKQHGQWHEIYAPNKTLARKQFYGRIDQIIEIKK